MYNSTLSLTSALDGGEWSTPRHGRFTPEELPRTHCIGGWVGRKTGLDSAEKLAFTVFRSQDRPALSDSLQFLRLNHIYRVSRGQ